MARIRTGGPKGAKRPFVPAIGLNTDVEYASDALDSIARSLAAIDHSLEILTGTVGAIFQEMQLKN